MKDVQTAHGVQICLMRFKGDSDWLCQSITLFQNGCRHHIARLVPSPLNTVLCDEFSCILMQYLTKLEALETVSLPRAAHILPQTELCGLHASMTSDEESQFAVFQFKECSGDPLALLEPSAFGMAARPTDLEVLVGQAIQDVLQPSLLLFDSILEQGFQDLSPIMVAARLKTLVTLREHLEENLQVLETLADRFPQDSGDQVSKETRLVLEPGAEPKVAPKMIDRETEITWTDTEGWRVWRRQVGLATHSILERAKPKGIAPFLFREGRRG